MYRILLADDEGIMLESLKSIISSNYGNECEIHTAKTGRAVVEEAEKYPPDICFMDIQMPGLSGIQAIREIQKFNRSVVFVIITAYDKFNYAKEAVNLGVMEFLTKPVNKKVILETCSKAMDQVDSTRQKRSDDLKIREKLETVVPMIESGYINNILLQDDFQTYQDNYKELLDIQEEYGYMIVAEFGDSTENGVLTNAVGASVKANKFYSTFREIAQGFFECLVGPIMGNRIVILVPYRNPKESYEERVEVVTRTRNMVHKLESRIDSKFRCGIGRVKELGSTMKESFKEAMIALRESTSHVIHIEDVPAAQKYDGEYPRDLERRYENRVIDKDVAGALNCAEEFFRWMENQPGVSMEDMQIKVLELVMGVEKKAFFAGTVKYAISYRRNYIHELQACTDMEGMKKWFLDKTSEICSNMESAREKEAVSIIEKAKSYIRDNYKKDISLDEVSREVDISPYYFSKLFKQETGGNFIEYLTEIRLRNARELLKDSGLSIKEICAESGYSDPNYFSRIFKKYEGVTPSEFRERLRQDIMSGGKIFRKFLIFLCLAALMLTGCTSAKTEEAAQQEIDGKEENGEKKIQIGLTVDSFVIERWIRDRDVFVATARDLGAEVNVQDAGADAQEQISQIDYFIKKHMDVIVIIARDCGALSEAVERAHSAGIRVISYDRMVNDANTDMYISFDNRMVGEIMAQSMEEAIPDGGKIFMIQGSATDNNVAMVKEGFEDTLQGSNLQVVYEANCEGWTAELAVDYVEEALEEYPDVKGIMCGNDDIASQVIQVLAENQLAGQVIVVGQDGDLAACQRIVEGTQYMTAFKSIEDLARQAAKYAVKMAEEGKVSSDVTDTVNDGSYDVPAKVLEPVAVTRDNIDEVIIDGGFHRRDEVYLNTDYDTE